MVWYNKIGEVLFSCLPFWHWFHWIWFRQSIGRSGLIITVDEPTPTLTKQPRRRRKQRRTKRKCTQRRQKQNKCTIGVSKKEITEKPKLRKQRSTTEKPTTTTLRRRKKPPTTTPKRRELNKRERKFPIITDVIEEMTNTRRTLLQSLL